MRPLSAFFGLIWRFINSYVCFCKVQVAELKVELRMAMPPGLSEVSSQEEAQRAENLSVPANIC